MKNLEYYLNLPYKVDYEKIPFSEGGGFNASYPELGSLLYSAYGFSREEALENLKVLQEKLFKAKLEKGETIEEPSL